MIDHAEHERLRHAFIRSRVGSTPMGSLAFTLYLLALDVYPGAISQSAESLAATMHVSAESVNNAWLRLHARGIVRREAGGYVADTSGDWPKPIPPSRKRKAMR